MDRAYLIGSIHVAQIGQLLDRPTPSEQHGALGSVLDENSLAQGFEKWLHESSQTIVTVQDHAVIKNICQVMAVNLVITQKFYAQCLPEHLKIW